MRRKNPEDMVRRRTGRHGFPPAIKALGRYDNKAGGIPCPICSGGTLTIDSRRRPAGIKRRRCCVECGNRFTTWEVAGNNPLVAKISLQTIAHELRQLTERFERLAEMSGETDNEKAA